MKKVSYVDTIIGSVGDERATFCHGGGKTYPGACMPGGMVQLSPDTISAGDNTSGYNYCGTTIEGFSFNHLGGVGWYGDLGNLQIMPVVGKTDLRSGSNAELPFKNGVEGWKSAFSHDTEHTRPGYYAVNLDRYGIGAEATVSVHTGYLRFTYPAGDDCGLIFNFSRRIAGKVDFQHVEVVSDRCLEGYLVCTPAGGGWGRGKGGVSYTLYFTLELSKPMERYRFFSDEAYLEEGLTVCDSADLGLDARFGMDEGEALVLRCGISYTDLAGARENLRREGQGFDFDAMAARALDAWEDALSCVEVEGSCGTDLVLFYTCLYHTLLDPRTAADADGRFRLADGVHSDAGYVQRTLFSGWDVYRSEFPLLTLIRPDMVNDTINSLLAVAKSQNSSIPRFELNGVNVPTMNGDAGVIIGADAYCKGIRDFDADGFFARAMAAAEIAESFEGKPFRSLRLPDPEKHREIYRAQAYAPGSLSITLGLLIADFALAQMAGAMGYEEAAAALTARTARYGENYNPATGFMGPRDECGRFIPVRDEFDETGCTEANILQQTWEVPYDVEGLFGLLGRERGIALLEEFFEKADLSALWNIWYNHSNEPCHNLTHYFNILGLPHRTQYWTRRVQKESYRQGAFGFCGNEDVGQISGWYVLSAMGFAQVCPTDKRYQVNTPLFRRVSLRLSKRYHTRRLGDTFTVICDRDPLEYPYIEKLRLNGEEISRRYVTYEEIVDGGELEFILASEPV